MPVIDERRKCTTLPAEIGIGFGPIPGGPWNPCGGREPAMGLMGCPIGGPPPILLDIVPIGPAM